MLQDLKNLNPDDDGDLILFHEYGWVEEIKAAYDELVCYKAILEDLKRGVDNDYYVDLLHVVGLQEDL